MRREPATFATGSRHEVRLTLRELDVLRCPAEGLSCDETRRRLFLSLNTGQFHVKNIYGKLQVNKRGRPSNGHADSN